MPGRSYSGRSGDRGRPRVAHRIYAWGAVGMGGVRALVGVVVLATALIGAAGPAQAAFQARGSVEQVYVTGLTAGDKVTLLERSGDVVATDRASKSGSALFREVKPGSGYRVRAPKSGGLSKSAQGRFDTIEAARPERLRPVDPIRRLWLPDHPGRDQARLLGPPADRCHQRPRRQRAAAFERSLPHADRVLGLWLRTAIRPAERYRAGREPHGLCRGRREHARHGLLGRGLRLLRAAPGPRRVRRDRDHRAAALGQARQGGHARHLLRGHQPAVHRRDPAAEPRGHNAALGARPDPDDALPGRDPQHGLRPELGGGARSRRPSRRDATAGRSGRSSGSGRATRSARRTRSSTARRPTC